MTKRTSLFFYLILFAAAFLRLYQLGLAAFGGDEIMLINMARRGVPLADVLSKWKDVSGGSSQMPMPAFLMQLFLTIVPLAPSAFSVRLPFALVGIATVAVAFFAARRFSNDRTALIFMALVAISPYHLQFTREAYFYATAFLGFFLYFWAIAECMNGMMAGRKLTAGPLAIVAGSIFFSAYSQMTGFIICGASVPFWFGLIYYTRKVNPALVKSHIIRLGVVHTILLFPHLFVSWGPRTMLAEKASGASAQYAKAAAISGENLFTLLGKLVSQYAWGYTWYGLLILAVVLVGFVIAIRRYPRSNALILAYFIPVPIVIFALAREIFGSGYDTRYLAATFPFITACLAVGIAEWQRRIEERVPSTASAALSAVVPLVALGANAYPAWLVTGLTGRPTPYVDVVNWCDSHLPRGTPVLVDRWFEPWNELRTHNPTNASFTFSIPNEPVEVFLSQRWRDSAKNFFAKYPDAVYLEIAKEYWHVADVGAWSWPPEYFSQHVGITNVSGLKLRKMGLAARGDFYWSTTNRVVVDIYYNSRDDIIQKLNQSGAKLYALYGAGWNYTKTQDYRDWRVLESEATLELLNLTQEPMVVDLRIRAAAMGSSKQVQITPEIKHTFSSGQMGEWIAGPMELKPGINLLRISDPLWTLAQVPLLVDQVQVRPASAAPAATAPVEAPTPGG